MKKETKIVDDYYSQCCIEPIFIHTKVAGLGLFCSGCKKQSYSTMNKKVAEQVRLKRNKS